MDEIVRQAMAKWPRVPHCYGWLGLDARGNWYLRDAGVQALGPFAAGAPACRGSLIEHAGLIAFIGRNYGCDAEGQWYFQNGPQRVFVELEITPWIWRVDEAGCVTAHTAAPAHVRRCLLDEMGRLYLDTDIGFGLVHSLDVPHAAEAVESGRWAPEPVSADTLAQRFAYCISPQARHARA